MLIVGLGGGGGVGGTGKSEDRQGAFVAAPLSGFTTSCSGFCSTVGSSSSSSVSSDALLGVGILPSSAASASSRATSTGSGAVICGGSRPSLEARFARKLLGALENWLGSGSEGGASEVALSSLVLKGATSKTGLLALEACDEVVVDRLCMRLGDFGGGSMGREPTWSPG